MTIGVWPRMHQPTCAWCRSFPCACPRRMCVCGRPVDKVGDSIPATVRAHQSTPEHVAWRARGGFR